MPQCLLYSLSVHVGIMYISLNTLNLKLIQLLLLNGNIRSNKTLDKASV